MFFRERWTMVRCDALTTLGRSHGSPTRRTAPSSPTASCWPDPERAKLVDDYTERYGELDVWVVGVLGPEESLDGCVSGSPDDLRASEGSEHGAGYAQVAVELSGSWVPLCALTAEHAFRRSYLGPTGKSLELPWYPIPRSMRVFVDGTELPHLVPNGGGPGWSYSGSHNALRLWGIDIAHESVLDVSTLSWVQGEE
jgi:hypothetical protein